MVRPKKVVETPQKLAQNRALWELSGSKPRVDLTSWDPKQVRLVDAILNVLSSGATVVMRPGSGGGCMGVAIWEGDMRHPPVWCYTSDELDAWADSVMSRIAEVDALE